MSVLYAITYTVLSRSNFRDFNKAAMRILLPVLVAAITVQVSFSQQRRAENLPNKPDVVNEGQSKANLTPALAPAPATERTSNGKMVSEPAGYEIFSNANGGFSYRIMDGDEQVFSVEVPSASDATSINRTEAERQAQIALEVYRTRQGLSVAEMISEVNYRVQISNSRGSLINQGGINQNTLAFCTYTGTVQTGDPTTIGRLFRDGVASTCANVKTCPAGTPFGSSTYNYDVITLPNTTGASVCVSVTVAATGGSQIHGTAYLGSFNPANHCQNYLADCGSSSTGAPVPFSFTLAAGATVVIVVYNPIAGTTTTNWTVTVDGLTCGGAPGGPITITDHPNDTSVCPTTNATFTVAATPPGVSFNWQEDRGSGFVYLANGGVYSGVTTATLTLTGVTASMNGWQYRAVVTTAGQLPQISNPATLTVLPALPAPGVSPTSSIICVGGVQQLNITTVSSPTDLTTASGAITVAIPDNNLAGVTHTIPVAGVPGGATVQSISVNFNLTHTWDSDLEINLVAPNGNILNLVNNRGGSGDNFTNTTISSTSATSLGTGTAPFTGTFAADAVLNQGPTGFLSNVTSFTNLFSVPNGNWQLAIVDKAGGDIGTLTSWSITITYGAPLQGIWSPLTGLFLDAGLTTPYTGTPASTVYASPAVTTTYSAVLNNGSCNSGSTTATVTVRTPPVINTQPSGSLACVDNVKTFSVSATGSNLTYQWQVDQGGGFVNITNAAPYSGATSSTLTINPVSLALNGYSYRVIVGGYCPPQVTSNAVVLTVNPLPVVTVSPTGQCSPVVLTATGADTYSWSPAAGLSSTTGATVTATTSVNMVYVVTGTVTATGCKNFASVNVLGLPRAPILSPSSATICLGGSQLISASPYQSFSNTASITIPSAGVGSPYPSNINVSGLPTSGITVKSVTLNGMNHTWPDDIDIVLQSPTGTNVILMSDAGGSADLTGQTYTFDDAAAGLLQDGGFNATGTYRPSNYGTPDNFPAPGPGSVSQASPALNNFGAGNHNGTWRLFVVDAFAGDAGNISGGWTITFNVGGSTVVFSPTTGLYTDAGLTTPYTGTAVTQVYASPATTTTYSVVGSNSGPGPVTSSFTSADGPVTIPGTGSGAGTGAPANPYPTTIVVSGVPVGAIVKSVTLNKFSHTFPSDVDIVLQSPTGTNVILTSDLGSGTDANNAVLEITDGAPALPSAFVSGVYSAGNSGTPDAFPAPGPGSVSQASPSLSLFGNADHNGTWNLFIADDAGGDIGSLTSWTITFAVPASCTSPATEITITVHEPIVFTEHPVNQTACEEGDVTFTVAATGTIQSYQWQVSTNGGTTWTNIAGATSSSLTLSGVTTAMNNYQYRAVLSSAGCGNNPSNAAVLTVNPLPTVSLTASPYTQLRPGMLTTLSVSSSPAAASWEWFLNGVVIPTATTSTHVVDAFNLGNYSVTVTDVNGCVNTSNIVAITALPSSNLFIFPNPATSGMFTVTYYTPQTNWPVTINVIDMKGRRIESRYAVTTGAYTRFDFSTSKLQAGVYVIEFRNPGGERLAAGRVVVMH